MTRGKGGFPLRNKCIDVFHFLREDDDYFTCITKAAEILSNPVKRRAFDSVDPTFDDSVPSEIKSGDKVYS